MENSGWIKLHRRILDDPIITDDGLFRLFIYCLLNANFKEKSFIHGDEPVKVLRGQFITGRKVLAEKLNINDTTVYHRLKRLQKLKYISIKPNNRYSLITIINYNTYVEENSDEISDTELT